MWVPDKRLGGPADLKTLLIASLTANMMQVASDGAIRGMGQSTRSNGTVLRWMCGEMDVVFYNINLANGCQRAAMPHTHCTHTQTSIFEGTFIGIMHPPSSFPRC